MSWEERSFTARETFSGHIHGDISYIIICVICIIYHISHKWRRIRLMADGAAPPWCSMCHVPFLHMTPWCTKLMLSIRQNIPFTCSIMGCMETPEDIRCVWRPILGAHGGIDICIDMKLCMCAASQAACCLHIHSGDQVCWILEIYSISLQPPLPVILLRPLLSDILLLPRQQNTLWLGSSAWRVCACVEPFFCAWPGCVARAGGSTAGVCEWGTPEMTQGGTNLLENEAHCVSPSTTAVQLYCSSHQPGLWSVLHQLRPSLQQMGPLRYTSLLGE